MNLRGLLAVLTAATLALATEALPAQPGFRSAVAGSRAGNASPGQANRQASGPADDIAKIRSEWAKALRAKQLDQIVLLYAPDAVFLPPTGERVTGRPAIRDLTKKIMETFTSDINLDSIVMEHSGSLAYDSGDYSETLVTVADGAQIEAQGNYLMIFKRQPEGNWLIIEQAWTEVLPATK
jgi:uncharacterized protein (TIGR02246 family)